MDIMDGSGKNENTEKVRNGGKMVNEIIVEAGKNNGTTENENENENENVGKDNGTMENETKNKKTIVTKVFDMFKSTNQNQVLQKYTNYIIIFLYALYMMLNFFKSIKDSLNEKFVKYDCRQDILISATTIFYSIAMTSFMKLMMSIICIIIVFFILTAFSIKNPAQDDSDSDSDSDSDKKSDKKFDENLDKADENRDKFITLIKDALFNCLKQFLFKHSFVILFCSILVSTIFIPIYVKLTISSTERCYRDTYVKQLYCILYFSIFIFLALYVLCFSMF